MFRLYILKLSKDYGYVMDIYNLHRILNTLSHYARETKLGYLVNEHPINRSMVNRGSTTAISNTIR